MALSDEDKRTIRGTIIRSVVLSVLAGVTAGGAAVFAWLKDETANIFDPMPTGNVVVTSVVECRELGNGWEPFDEAGGRFIVGAGGHTSDSISEYNVFGLPENEANPRRKSAMGGAESVALELDEMPRHAHISSPPVENKGFPFWSPYGVSGTTPMQMGFAPGFFASPANSVDSVYPLTSAVGGNANGDTMPHDNIPPYIALYFCKKD
ncbi:MAG: hypothetical protein AAGH83_08570 [Pseudomonadota bacterium]